MLTNPPRTGTWPIHAETKQEEKLHVLPGTPATGQVATDQPRICGGDVAHHPTPVLVTWRTENLRPLPIYEQLGFQPSAPQLSSIDALGDNAFADPIVVTQDGYIIDGNARLQQARHRNRQTLLCLQYELTPEEALLMFLQRHRRIQGLNAFCRIRVALHLEADLREKARSNQQLGGRNKGSSRLTEAGRVDVRRETARVAGVSVGNVSKVKRILSGAITEVLFALTAGEISINWAWLLVRGAPQDQQEVLERYLQAKYMRPQLARLVSQHFTNNPTSITLSLEDLSVPFQMLPPEQQREIIVIRLQMPIKVVAITSGVAKLLNTQKQMDFK